MPLLIFLNTIFSSCTVVCVQYQCFWWNCDRIFSDFIPLYIFLKSATEYISFGMIICIISCFSPCIKMFYNKSYGKPHLYQAKILHSIQDKFDLHYQYIYHCYFLTCSSEYSCKVFSAFSFNNILAKGKGGFFTFLFILQNAFYQIFVFT